LFQAHPPHEVHPISSWYGYNWHWSPDATLVFGQVLDLDADNTSPETLILSVPDLTLVNNPALSSGNLLQDFSPDATKMVFSSESSGSYDLYVADTDGSNINQLTFSDAFERYLGWSADGTKIFFTANLNGNEDIYFVPVNGTGIVQLTDTAVAEFMAQWQPLP
jgi:Tol biopolymer transport system component